MALKNLTFTQRLAAGCGCVTFLVVALLVGGYVFLTAWQGDRSRHELSKAPSGWMDSIRTASRLPDLTGLTLARTDSGDAAAALRGLPRRPRIELGYRAIVGLREATAEDSAAWRDVMADTALNGVVALARRQHYRALDVALAADSAARHNLLRLPGPRIGNARDATRALVIRAMMRLRRGDRAGAREDLAAVTALGEQAARHEPTVLGGLIGRAQLSSAARGWERFAERTGDSALAARARDLLAWAGRRPHSFSYLVMLAPDSALALARDSSLTLGMRGEALAQLVMGRALTPRGFIFGLPRRETRALAALAEETSGDMATLTTVAIETARRTRFMGFMRVLREAGPAS